MLKMRKRQQKEKRAKGKRLESSVIISTATWKKYFLNELGELVKSYEVTLQWHWLGKKTSKVIEQPSKGQKKT